MRVIDVDPLCDPRWDAYVASRRSGALPFHTSAWLRVLQAENGQRPIGLAVERDGRLLGILPLMRTRGLPLGLGAGSGGRRLASLPRTPLAGPLADDDRAAAALMREAVARTPPGHQLQLKLSDAVPDGAVPGLQSHPWRLTFVVELPERTEDIRFGASRHHTRAVAAARKARSAGVVVRPAGSLGEVRTWYRLYLETMRHHAVPPRPWRMFARLWDELRPAGMLNVLLAVRGDRLIAGNLLVTDGATAFYLFNGADRRALKHRPNDLLHIEAIERLTATGHRRYDLGEVVEGHDGLARFKRKLGAREQRLHRAYAPPPDAPPDPGDDPDSRVRRLGHAAWRRVPLAATAAAGTAAARLL